MPGKNKQMLLVQNSIKTVVGLFLLFIILLQQPISEFSHDRYMVPKLWRKSEAKCEVVIDGMKNKSSKGRFHGRLIALFIR